MKRILDQSTWNRKEHFDFFRKFDEPFFGIVTEIDCTKAYQISKEKKQSFFAYYLHLMLIFSLCFNHFFNIYVFYWIHFIVIFGNMNN